MLINRLLTATARYCIRCGHTTLIPSSLPRSLRATYPVNLLSSSCETAAMELKHVVGALEVLAPCSLAEDWDNVGLLVEPSPPHMVRNILLTNDLTDAVVDEVTGLAQAGEKMDLIVSYHPPIFKPLKRIAQRSTKERIIVWAIENRVAVYSPHTASDSVWGGVNDWLVSGCGEGIVKPLTVKELPAKSPHTLLVQGSGVTMEKAQEVIGSVVSSSGSLTTTPDGTWNIELPVTTPALTSLVTKLPQALPDCTISVKPTPKVLSTGPGRLLTLSSATPLQSLIARVKQHLNLTHLRLALPLHSSMESSVSTVAVCAGSGASLLRGVAANVYLTGEMSHHELLEATAAGTTVILTEHSNSERGYLKVLQERLMKTLLKEGVKIRISLADKDPVTIV